MKAEWIIDKKILKKIQNVIDLNKSKDFVKERYAKNIEKKDIDLSKEYIWQVLVGCEITSQQKSGAGSPVDLFLKSQNDVLIYDKFKLLNPDKISYELSTNSLRNNVNISEWLYAINKNLENGEWNVLLKKLEELKNNPGKDKEIEVADYLWGKKIKNAKVYKGIGLKQSRNFLQWLGLTEYEIPIDSREIKVLAECGVNFIPGATGLQDRTTYMFLEQGIQKICEELKIKPCILDACFFANFEKDNFIEEI